MLEASGGISCRAITRRSDSGCRGSAGDVGNRCLRLLLPMAIAMSGYGATSIRS